jgi:hypothetical protein
MFKDDFIRFGSQQTHTSPFLDLRRMPETGARHCRFAVAR